MSTAGTFQSYRNPLNPHVGGAAAVKNAAALIAAAAYAGTDPIILLIQPGTWTIDQNVTLPATMKVKYDVGAFMAVADGVTFNHAAEILAGPNQQIFTFPGTGTGIVNYALPKSSTWWTGIPDGVTANTVGLRKLMGQPGRIHIEEGHYRTAPLSGVSDQHVTADPDTIIQATAGYGSTDCLFRWVGKSNVTFDGGGCILRGIRTNDSEFRMAIRIDETEDFLIQNYQAEDWDGDGLYLGTSINTLTAFNLRTTVRNVRAVNCRRQGMSVISAVDLDVEDFYAESIGGTDPGAAVDIEPDSDYAQLRNLRFRNIYGKDCEGCTFLVHLNRIDGTQEAGKKMSIFLDGLYGESCDASTLRVTSVISDNLYMRAQNIISIDAGENGIKVGNFSSKSRLHISDWRIINPCQKAVDADWEFPGWAESILTAHPEAKVPVLVYSNTSLAWEALNGGTGLLMGGVLIEHGEVLDDAVDRYFFYSSNYNVAQGAANGTIRFPIRDTVLRNIRIRNLAGKAMNMTAAYAQDVLFDDIPVWDPVGLRWNPATIATAVAGPLAVSDNTHQGIRLTNTGAAGVVVGFTLPGAQANPDFKQRFRFRVTDADGMRITTTAGDFIRTQNGGRGTTINSFQVGSEIYLEKEDVNTWAAAVVEGRWNFPDVYEFPDADYTAGLSDWGTMLSDALTTAARQVNLPQVTADQVGYRLGLVDRSSGFRPILHPFAGDRILAITAAANNRVQSAAFGNVLIVEYIGNQTWAVVGREGTWTDIGP